MADDTKNADKKKKLEALLENIYARKIAKQYEFLKAWDRKEITGVECIQGIEEESKVYRIDSDLFAKKV